MNPFLTDGQAVCFYASPSTDPYWNLAAEEHLFSTLPPHTACLYLWRNDRTVVIGNYQNAVEEIDPEYIEAHQIKVARRMSGGGAVYHDLGNLNFSIILDDGAAQPDEFLSLAEPVLQALHRLHVPAELTGRNDIMIHGRKISGCAQYRSGDRLLCHGCIMLDTDLRHLLGALNVHQLKIDSYSTKSVSSHVAAINQCVPSPIPMARLIEAIKESFLSGANARPYVPSSEDLRAIERLRTEKYGTWDWNYGHYAEYRIQKEQRYPYGLIKLSMNVQDACIQDILIQGDFFGDGDIQELTGALKGLRLDDSLEEALEALDIPAFIHGMSARELGLFLRF